MAGSASVSASPDAATMSAHSNAETIGSLPAVSVAIASSAEVSRKRTLIRANPAVLDLDGFRPRRAPALAVANQLSAVEESLPLRR